MALDGETMQGLLESVARFVRERLRPLEHQVAQEDRIPAVVHVVVDRSKVMPGM